MYSGVKLTLRQMNLNTNPKVKTKFPHHDIILNSFGRNVLYC